MSNYNLPTDILTVLSNGVIVKLRMLSIALVVLAAVVGYVELDFSNRPVAHGKPTQKVETQDSFSGMARCEQLYTTWSDHYANDGSPALGAHMRAESAIAECERGDSASGIAEIERLLRQGGIHILSAQTPLTR